MEQRTVIVFARVSSKNQSCDRQIEDLKKYSSARGLDVVKVICETISGATKLSERSAISDLIASIRIHHPKYVAVTELSRLGRTREVLELIELLHNHKVSLLIQDLNLETLDKEGRPSFMAELLTSIINVMNKSERSSLIERVVSGIRAAQERGIHCGRPKNSQETQEEFLSKYKKVIKDLRNGLSIRKASKLHNLSPVTVCKISKLIIH